MTDKNTDQQDSSNAKKGVASMPHEEVQEIAKKGGEASASQAEHEGMTDRGGHQGGQVSGTSRRKESEDEKSEEDNET